MSIPLFDCHCDTIVAADYCNEKLRKNKLHLDLERLSCFSPCAQVFAVCTAIEKNSEAEAERIIKKLKQELNENSDLIRLCLSSADIDKAVSENKIAAFISVEGAEQICTLNEAYELGVRIIHPNWNYDNEYCGAAIASGSGLSEKGKAFVTSAQSMGFLLDMSHISEKGFYDVLEISTKPVIAGHSNSASVHSNPRNITDDQFRALASYGGGVGINFFPEFLGKNGDISAIIAHIEHFLSLGGEHSVFLGCDLDGIETTPKGINGVQDLGLLYNELLRLNYTEACVKDIFYNNLRDIIGRVL